MRLRCSEAIPWPKSRTLNSTASIGSKTSRALTTTRQCSSLRARPYLMPFSLGTLDLLDTGDVVQDGDGSATGHGRGGNLEDAARQKRRRTALADHALLERDANAGENVRVADGLHQGVADAHRAALR